MNENTDFLAIAAIDSTQDILQSYVYDQEYRSSSDFYIHDLAAHRSHDDNLKRQRSVSPPLPRKRLCEGLPSQEEVEIDEANLRIKELEAAKLEDQNNRSVLKLQLESWQEGLGKRTRLLGDLTEELLQLKATSSSQLRQIEMQEEELYLARSSAAQQEVSILLERNQCVLLEEHVRQWEEIVQLRSRPAEPTINIRPDDPAWSQPASTTERHTALGVQRILQANDGLEGCISFDDGTIQDPDAFAQKQGYNGTLYGHAVRSRDNVPGEVASTWRMEVDEDQGHGNQHSNNHEGSAPMLGDIPRVHYPDLHTTMSTDIYRVHYPDLHDITGHRQLPSLTAEARSIDAVPQTVPSPHATRIQYPSLGSYGRTDTYVPPNNPLPSNSTARPCSSGLTIHGHLNPEMPKDGSAGRNQHIQMSLQCPSRPQLPQRCENSAPEHGQGTALAGAKSDTMNGLPRQYADMNGNPGTTKPASSPSQGQPAEVNYTAEERKKMLDLALTITRKRLNLTADADIIAHYIASDELVHLFTQGKHPGPRLDDLHLHLVFDHHSLWDRRAVALLVNELEEQVLKELKIPSVDRDYLESIMWGRYRHIRDFWKQYRPVNKGDGVIETPDEAYTRYRERLLIKQKANRKNSRRNRKYTARLKNIHVLQQKARLNGDIGGGHWEALSFLENMITELGPHCMSEEETDSEDQSTKVVLTIPWRRKIDDELAMIDNAKDKYNGLFDTRGPKAARRVRRRGRYDNRKHIAKLPRSLYNSDWLASKTPEFIMDEVKPKDDTSFRWMEIGDLRAGRSRQNLG